MTIRVTIDTNANRRETYFALNDGVQVLASGALELVSSRSEVFVDGKEVPSEFRIYAPGRWLQVEGIEVNDE